MNHQRQAMVVEAAGVDTGHLAPSAQSRTCGTTASGSHVGWERRAARVDTDDRCARLVSRPDSDQSELLAGFGIKLPEQVGIDSMIGQL